jgi:hypothetical protein
MTVQRVVAIFKRVSLARLNKRREKSAKNACKIGEKAGKVRLESLTYASH